MRWSVAVAATLTLASCKRGRVDDVGDLDTGPPPSALGCPEGSIDIGGQPPVASEFWCGRQGDEGRMVRHGAYWSFYSDGTPKEHGAYANNAKTGRWWSWDADGRLTQEGDYDDNEETGYWILYDSDGRVSAEGPMANGGRHGVWTAYDPDTRVANEGTWSDGERDGTWIIYDGEGNALRERNYRNGRLVSQREL
jgi:hypothetical protein